jgi:hypothetical protein
VYRLIEGSLFTKHKEYVRRQIIYSLLQVIGTTLGRIAGHAWLTEAQEDDNPTLHLVAAFLLYDGRHSADDVTFEMMQAEGVFQRLVELIQTESVQEDTPLHRMLLELMYESSRIQRLSWEDLSTSNINAPRP